VRVLTEEQGVLSAAQPAFMNRLLAGIRVAAVPVDDEAVTAELILSGTA